MLKIEYTGETEGVKGTYDGSIHIIIDPAKCDDTTEEEMLSAYKELFAFYCFKNNEKVKTTRKTKKCDTGKNVIDKPQGTSEISSATSPVIITEGCNKGKTFEEVYENEGSRAILFIARNAKSPELRQAAEEFLKEQDSDL